MSQDKTVTLTNNQHDYLLERDRILAVLEATSVSNIYLYEIIEKAKAIAPVVTGINLEI